MAVRLDIFPPRYQDVRHLARGGMGDVYRATDTVLGRTVALKLLAERYADDEDIKRRFKNEALAAARLSNAPFTVTIFDVGEAAEQPFIVMELLEGGSLEERLRNGPPDTRDVLRWLGQAAEALDAGHAAGVVHRDVKPGNLLLDSRGDVHVADFGVASAVGLDSMTMTGMVLGTAGYLSPEQARGERATPASDRYGLAIVAWELLTGRRPFESESPTAEAAAHVNAPVPAISQKGGLPRELDPAFERALAKDPAARYSSAAEFVGALRDALRPSAATTQRLAGLDEDYAAPAPVSAGRPSAVVWAGLALLALLLLGGGLALAGVFGGDEPQTRTVVKEETITRPGTTVTTEVTTTTPATTGTTAPTTATTGTTGTGRGSAGEAEQLNNDAFALMNEGRYEEALPMLERAIDAVRGTGTLTEAYTSYNLAYTRLQLGRCDQVLELLDRSQSLQRPRSEIARARRQAKERCD